MIARALSRMFSRRAWNIGNPISLTDFLDSGLQSLGGPLTRAASGVKVSHETSLKIGSVWQAVSMISGDVAMMPFHVYRRLEKGFREIDDMHPADYLISVQPNEEMSAFELWRRHIIHALMWQNGYIWVERPMKSRAGEPIGLYNLLPDRTWPARDSESGLLYYKTHVTNPDGRTEEKILQPHEVIHTKGLCIENDAAYDLVRAARDAYGLALAAQGFASKFFAQGAGSGGILEIPASFTEQAKANLVEGFVNGKTGPDNWFKVAILRDGAKFHATTNSPKDAELTSLSEVQVRQVARYFNVPPFKLGLEDSNAYKSAEMAQLVYLMSCLNHWMAAVKGACAIKLLSETERMARTHFLAHNSSVLVETDTKTLNDVLAIQRQNKIINANEWRSKLNLAPRDDEDADKYENPNTSSNAPAPQADAPVDPPPTAEQKRLLSHYLAKAGRRIASQLVNADADKWRKEEPRQRRMFADDMRPLADTLSVDGRGLCNQWEEEIFRVAESLLSGDGDKDEILGRTLPESLANRLGENNGFTANQPFAA